MKKLILVITLTIASISFAKEKCYKSARYAAIQFAMDSTDIKSSTDFSNIITNETSEITNKDRNSQVEIHSFYNSSFGIISEVQYFNGKCFVNKTYQVQNDQDQD